MKHRRRSAQKSRQRRIRFETLERRNLLASLWQNPLAPLDVNDDQFISPIDALLVINRINASGGGALSGRPDSGDALIDTNGDRFVAPIDVLLVINHINSGNESNGRATAPFVLSEATGVRELYVPIELGEASGVRRLRLGIEADFDESDRGSALEDSFAVYIVDRYTRQTIVDRGTQGTSLFTLSGNSADFLPGQARFDGQTLELDISTGLADQQSALLLLQLINTDNDSDSTLTITPLENAVIEDAVTLGSTASSGSVSAASAAIQLDTLQENGSIVPQLENMRYDALRDVFTAEIYLENEGLAVGRDVVLVLPGIDSDSVRSTVSGSTADGKAYINFRDAIPSGGLDHGARTNRIGIEIDALLNPLRFPYEVLVGAENQAPELAPLNSISIRPGESLNIPLVASDLDGDKVRFSVRPGASTPNMFLDREGVLRIAPTPSDIGTHRFEIAASDGLLSSTQFLTVNVLPDSVTTTRVRGTVLDVDQTPLVGVRIEIGAVQALTGPDGSFLLDLGSGPVVAETIKIRGELLSSAAYPFIAEKLPFVLEHDVFVGYENIIHRPIYLPKLDIANGMTVNPTQDTLVTTAAIPGASVMVKAGTLLDQRGTPFSGKLTITEVPRELTPASLPDNLLPDLVVTIQPGEMVFASPAALSLPNRAGWAAGTVMDLWSINPVTGEFEIVGAGAVSSDGSVIETTEGGIRNSSWHAWILRLVGVKAGSSEPICDVCQPTGESNSRVNLFNGAITEQHTVFTYSSLGQSRSIDLSYNSLRADVRPAVDFTATLQCIQVAALGNPNQKMTAELLASPASSSAGNGSAFGGSTKASLASSVWSLPACSGGGLVELGGAIVGDMRGFPTGQYEFELKVGVTTTGVGDAPSGASISTLMVMPIINYSLSPFGSGWGIAGLQQIIENRDGSLLLIDDGGLSLRFAPPPSPGAAYDPPPGDFSVMEKLPDGTFRRTLKDQTVFQFNSDNKLATERDRNGNVTEYRYSNGRISEIVDPVGLTTKFEFSGSRLTAIIDPYGRRTETRHDAAGNLTRIIAPNGAETSWTYDSYHHTTSKTDANGNVGQDYFDEFGRATEVSFPDGSTASVRPMQSKGFSRVQIENETAPPPPATIERSANYVDSRGNAIHLVLDGAGQAKRVTDSLGQVFSHLRNTDNLISESFDGRGNLTSYEYDARGNLTKVTDIVSRVDFEADVTWIGGSGDWHDPSNWSTGEVPGPQDDVLIDLANSTVVVSITSSAAFANRLIMNEELTITGGSLKLAGESLISAHLELLQNSSITASGPEADVTLLNVRNGGGQFRTENGAVLRLPRADRFHDGTFLIASGGQLQLPLVTDLTGSSFTVSGSGTSFVLPSSVTSYTIASAGDRYFQAEDGGVLDLSSLTSLIPSGLGFTTRIVATSGGRVLMPNLTAIAGNSVEVRADDVGSQIDLTSLATWIGQFGEAGGRQSALYSRNGGTVNLPALTTVQDVHAELKGAGGLSTSQITSIRESWFLIADRAVDFSGLTSLLDSALELHAGGSVVTPQLSDITGSSFYVQGAGTSFVLPSAITTFSAGELAGDRYFQAKDGGVLDMSSLSILNTHSRGYMTRIIATSGGRVLLPNVTAITENSVEVRADDAGSQIDLTSLATWTGQFAGAGGRQSELSSRNGGSVNLPALTTVQDVSVELNGAGTLPTSQLTSIRESWFSIADRAVDFSGLTDFLDSGLELRAGSSVVTPLLADITGSSFYVQGTGTSFVLPSAITTYSAGDVAGDRHFQADDGGVLDMSSLTTLNSHLLGYTTRIIATSGGRVLMPNLTAITENSVEVRADDAVSEIDLTALATWTGQFANGRQSDLFSRNGGVVNAPALTTVQDVSVELRGAGSLPTSQMTSIRESWFLISDRAVDFSSLTSFLDSGLDLHAGSSVVTPQLADITGSSFHVRGAGTTFVLPSAVTTYGAGDIAGDRYFQAENGGELDLSSLTTLNSHSLGYTTRIIATSGGRVLLPNVTAITENSVEVRADDADSLIDLTSLASWTGQFANGRQSTLSSRNGGAVNLPALTTVQDVSVELKGAGALPTSQMTSIRESWFLIADRAVDFSGLTNFLDSGLELHTGSSVVTPLLADITGSSFYARGAGTSFVLPSAITTYSAGEVSGDRYFQASDGGVLDISSLSSLTRQLLGYTTRIIATSGGRVLLPNLTAITENSVEVRADGTDSEVDLASLATWTGQFSGGGRQSDLYSRNGGTVNVPALTTVQDVSVELRGAGSLPTSQMTTIRESWFLIADRAVDFSGLTSFLDSGLDLHAGSSVVTPQLADITGSSFYARGAGTSFVLPSAITTYSAGEVTGDRYFQAQDGGVLDLSSLTSLTRQLLGYTTRIIATSGGRVLMPNLTAITENSVEVRADDAGSQIDLAGLATWTGQFANAGRHSDLYSRNGGTVNLPALTTLQDVDSSFSSAAGFSIAQITTWKESSITFTGGTFTFTNLTDADDTHLTISAARVEAPVLINIGDGVVTLSNGGVLDAPNLPGFGGGGEGPEGGSGNGTSAGGDRHATSAESTSSEGEDTPPSQVRPQTFAYDPTFSQLVQEVDELGRQTLHTIDPANGNRLQTRNVVGLNDLLSSETDDQVTTFTYTASGLLDVMTDPLGRVSDWDYDSLGRVVRVTVAKGTANEAVMLTEYDAFGNVSAEVDANGGRTEYAYDNRDRLTLVRDAVGNVTRYAYDAAGNMVQQTDARGNIWRYKYDRKQRMIETRDPLDHVTTYAYDRGGNMVSTTDPLGNTTRYEYDVRGRRVKTIDPDGGVTSFTYDLDDNLLTLTDPVGNTTTFQYDARSRQVTETDPLGKVIRYDYDAVDNLIRKTDRLNRITNYQYDELDRLVSETWVGGGNQVFYDYDLADNLLRVKDAFSELTYNYDAQDRVTSVDNAGTPGAPNVVLQYAYDAVGNVLSVTDSIEGTPNAVTGYQYDALNRLATLTQTAAPGATSTDIAFLPSDKRVDFTYNSHSQYEHIRRYSDLSGTGLVIDTAYAYDNVSRLQSIDHLNSAGTAVSFFHYQYDTLNRIAQITNINGVTDYSYDDRDQLIGANHTDPNNPDESYTYDVNGNRNSSHLHGNSYQIGIANRLLSDGTYDYQYDDEGNVTLRTEIATGATLEFQWDYRNRLVAVIDKDGSGTATQEVRFKYDAFDRRVAKSVETTPADATDAAITHFVYDSEDVILDFIDGEGAANASVAQRYLHGPTTDSVLAQESAVESAWLLADHLGTIQAAVSETGIITTYAYDSFGQRSISGQIDTRYGFTGRELDSELDLYYYRARYYSAESGRFVSEDPYLYDGVLANRFAYARNSPAIFSDPSGEFVPVVVAVAKWGIVAWQVYDAYQDIRTLLDNCASTSDRLLAAVGLIPGGDVLKYGKRGQKYLGVDELRRKGPSDTLLPDSYWINRQALPQVTPGTRTVNIKKPSSSGGTYHSTTHYDEFGRQIGQTHRTHHGYNDPNSSHFHPNPHHHRRDPITGEKLKDPRTGSRTWPGLFGNDG